MNILKCFLYNVIIIYNFLNATEIALLVTIAAQKIILVLSRLLSNTECAEIEFCC